MTLFELKAKLELHCPGAVITGSDGALAALRRQSLARYVKDRSALPPARPVDLQVQDPDGCLIGIVTAQFAEDDGLAFVLKLFEDKRDE